MLGSIVPLAALAVAAQALRLEPNTQEPLGAETMMADTAADAEFVITGSALAAALATGAASGVASGVGNDAWQAVKSWGWLAEGAEAM